MPHDLATVALEFVAIAHRIVFATLATSGPGGRPRTRVVQPLWHWDGESLTGWVTANTPSPKVADVTRTPWASVTYWEPGHDTCTADVAVDVITDQDELAAVWDRYLHAPPPVGLDLTVNPAWESAASPTFGALCLTPVALRAQPGTLMIEGTGEVLTWRDVHAA